MLIPSFPLDHFGHLKWCRQQLKWWRSCWHRLCHYIGMDFGSSLICSIGMWRALFHAIVLFLLMLLCAHPNDYYLFIRIFRVCRECVHFLRLSVWIAFNRLSFEGISIVHYNLLISSYVRNTASFAQNVAYLLIYYLHSCHNVGVSHILCM